ncbi:hypothetical protein CVT24_001515 [Panaeolus cyanescens]|uniref:Proline-rich protein n=1 Tax=Panaeolus cyanescens TaxID=181874 RepID=A0A409YF93_9AGAR|nr:hypothetical protein CVT24_001515 [Panaeolus cyanescens]
MVKIFSVALLGLVAASANAAPIRLNRRIAQVIAEATATWEQACLAAGGAERCNPLSVAAMSTLLLAGGPCDQQNAADNFMDLSKELNSNQMIVLSQIFAQQPRNSPNSVAIPYCQQAPRNSELNGLFQCQFAGSNQNTFVNNVALGGEGTIPFGRTEPVSPLGSCPIHPDGPVPDGQQLTNIVQIPDAPIQGGDAGGAAPAPAPEQAREPQPEAAPAPAPAPQEGGGGFVLDNGRAAQALNAEFAGLTKGSSCTVGQTACVEGEFAQCPPGADGNNVFVTTPCNGLTCAALPLVNSPGTSITCTTLDDARARIAATGATGGLTGSE